MNTKLFVFVSILAYLAVAVATVVLLSGCSGRRSTGVSRQAISAVPVNAADHGVLCNGVTDDREAIQAALTAGTGGVVRLPAGVCIVSDAPSYRCITVPAQTSLVGAGRHDTTIRMAAGAGESMRLLEVDGPGITLSDMSLDGNALAQSEDEHRAGVFVNGATDLRIERVDAFGFTGDGFDLYAGARITMTDVSATGNRRDGLTCNPWTSTTDVEVSRSVFDGNGAQQIDFEPKGSGICSRWDIHHNQLKPSSSGSDYTLVIAGSGATTPSKQIMVASNVINGSIQIAWVDDVVIARNTGDNSTVCIAGGGGCKTTVYRAVSHLSFVGNTFITSNDSAMVEVTGTGTGQDATSVVVAGNHLTGMGAVGVWARGARSLYVVGNTMTRFGASSPGSTAVYVRATNTATSFDRVVAADNSATGYERGVTASGNGAARLEMVLEDGNIWGPLYLDDGTGALRLATARTQVTRWPAGAVIKLQPGGSTTMERTP